MGAGILPTTIHKGKLYFLFGKEGKHEDSAPGFSDFGGGSYFFIGLNSNLVGV